MAVFRRIFLAAALAGAVAGLMLAAVQQWRLVPLIAAAETFETIPAHGHAAGTPAHDHAEASAWAPADGPERTFYTVLATTLAGMGFALVMGGVALVADIRLTPQTGIVWGLCGFAAFSLAPAIGLPPQLPGMAEAALGARQIWWWATVLVTGGALIGMAKFRTPLAIAVGVALIALPHLYGAPIPAEAGSAVPAELAAHFVAASLGAALIFWLIAGPLTGYLFQRFSKGAA